MIVYLITDEDEREYRELTQDVVDWCLWNHLLSNVGKTREMVADFHRRRHLPPSVNIQGTDVGRVDSYK